jgi:hypothetical protein
VGTRIKSREFRHAGIRDNVLILKKTASETGRIFELESKNAGTSGLFFATSS